MAPSDALHDTAMLPLERLALTLAGASGTIAGSSGCCCWPWDSCIWKRGPNAPPAPSAPPAPPLAGVTGAAVATRFVQALSLYAAKVCATPPARAVTVA